MPIPLFVVLLALVGFLVYRKMEARKSARPAAETAGPAILPPPRKFVL